MPPKKKGKDGDKKDKKGKEEDDGSAGDAAVKAFKAAWKRQCAHHGIEPIALPLKEEEVGDGKKKSDKKKEEKEVPFAKLSIHPAVGCSEKHGRALAESLLPYSYLQTLSFWSVSLHDEGVLALAAFLSSNKSVVTLELVDCGVSSIGCAALGEALERNVTLNALSLDYNEGVSDAGAEALGQGLRFN